VSAHSVSVPLISYLGIFLSVYVFSFPVFTLDAQEYQLVSMYCAHAVQMALEREQTEHADTHSRLMQQHAMALEKEQIEHAHTCSRLMQENTDTQDLLQQALEKEQTEHIDTHARLMQENAYTQDLLQQEGQCTRGLRYARICRSCASTNATNSLGAWKRRAFLSLTCCFSFWFLAHAARF